MNQIQCPSFCPARNSAQHLLVHAVLGVTLQQQIPSNVTFTYVTALDDPNTQIIRAEWAFNQQWSAIATPDQNGIFSIIFFYKKQFR